MTDGVSYLSVKFLAFTSVQRRPLLFLDINMVWVGSWLLFQDSLFVPSSRVKQNSECYIGHGVGSDCFTATYGSHLGYWRMFHPTPPYFCGNFVLQQCDWLPYCS